MNISKTYDDGILRIRLKGELDHYASETIRRGIEQELDRYLPRCVILDLSGLSFMDSSGIAVILNTKKRTAEISGQMLLIRPSAQPDKVLRTAGVERMISFLDRDKEASR